MTLADIKTMLEGITGLGADKVSYRMFPIGKVPSLPYCVFYSTGNDNFAADNKVYKPYIDVNIELYSQNKDSTMESGIESAMDTKGLIWRKIESYIDSEKMYCILYETYIQ